MFSLLEIVSWQGEAHFDLTPDVVTKIECNTRVEYIYFSDFMNHLSARAHCAPRLLYLPWYQFKVNVKKQNSRKI